MADRKTDSRTGRFLAQDIRADCHPERKHVARGLCSRCHDRYLYWRDPAKARERNRNKPHNKSRRKRFYYRHQEDEKTRMRWNHYWFKYRIRREDYERILNEQGGVCRICGIQPDDTNRKRLAVDHDHKTGKVRALLCVHCNASLGLLKEDAKVIGRLLRYVEEVCYAR